MGLSMDGRGAIHLILPIVGAGLMVLVLLDIFLTVLYARVGTSVFSNRFARLTWRMFRAIASLFPRRRGPILSYCGPAMLLLLVTIWAFGLMLGAAMIFHPRLGTSIRASGGSPTPTDFVTALYAAAASMSLIGAGDFVPRTSFFRLFYVFTSLVGFCMISLTLTYFMQIYSAVQRRNTAGLRAYLGTNETGDAAEFIAGLGPGGDFREAITALAGSAGDVAAVKEAHHFYYLLMYFRFRNAFYSGTCLALVMLDTVALIETALDDRRYRWLKESGAVSALERASMHLLTAVAPTLLPDAADETRPRLESAAVDRWRRRYFAALARLRQAGIPVTADENAGAHAYVERRSRWDPYIVAFADFMAYDLAEIDPAGCDPGRFADRRQFPALLRPAG